MRINYQPPTLQSVHERPEYQDLDLDSLEEVFQPEVSWQGVVNSFLRQGTLGKVGKPPSFNVDRKLAAATRTD